MNWSDIKTLASIIGVPGAMMVVFVWYLTRGKFVTGREFDAMKADRDEWKALALSSWTSAERMTTTTQAAVDHAAELTAAVVKKV